MITEIKNSITEVYGKRNWIDQNTNVLMSIIDYELQDYKGE